jgi:transcriptional regulator with XRE-family HTH domain
MDDLTILQKAVRQGVISGNRLAKEAGISQSTVSAIIRGANSPNLTTLQALTAALMRYNASWYNAEKSQR